MEFKLMKKGKAAAPDEVLVAISVPEGKYHTKTVRVSLSEKVMAEAGIKLDDKVILHGDTDGRVTIQAVNNQTGWKLCATKSIKVPRRAITYIGAPDDVRAALKDVRATHVSCAPSKGAISFKLERGA
jgi:hypothetical protein